MEKRPILGLSMLLSSAVCTAGALWGPPWDFSNVLVSFAGGMCFSGFLWMRLHEDLLKTMQRMGVVLDYIFCDMSAEQRNQTILMARHWHERIRRQGHPCTRI